MKEVSKMSDQMTFADSRNTISSQGSASGATPCGSPDGPMTNPSGPDHAHANLSARQAKEKGLLTSGTYGPPGIGLLKSFALQEFLANRLRQRTASIGSTLFRLTWKPKVTRSGRWYYQLVASAPRTSARDFGSWPTTKAWDGSGGGQVKRSTERGNLKDHALLAAFGKTPNGSNVSMVGRGQLNPDFSRWLMGLPDVWASCADTATLLWRRRRRK